MSSSHTRPTHVVQRDRAVAIILLNAAQPLADVTRQLHESGADTSASSHDVYRSVVRLRNQGYAVKVGTGSRTPQWGLTETGVAFAQEALAQPKAATPEPAPVPAPEPATEQLPLPDQPQPEHPHVIQPVPIAPPVS